MKIDGLLSDIFIADFLSPDNALLPIHWDIIYHEGTRKNHLLFEESDLALFESPPKELIAAIPDLKDTIEITVDRLWHAHDIRTMRAIIATENLPTKYILFRFYQNFLFWWREQLNNLLN